MNDSTQVITILEVTLAPNPIYYQFKLDTHLGGSYGRYLYVTTYDLDGYIIDNDKDSGGSYLDI